MTVPVREPLDVRAVAVLEEARIARSVADIGDESKPCAGGMLVRSGPGMWCNSAYGCGMAGPVRGAEVDALIDFYEEKCLEPRLELAALADQSMFDVLAARGFVLRSVEDVLARRVDGDLPEMPAGVEVRRVDAGSASEVDAFARLTASLFLPDGSDLPEEMIESMRRAARHPRVRSFVAVIGGEMVAGGSVEVFGEVACLFGAATKAEFRGRGAQTALIAQRLRVARESGARFATIGSRPGAHTARNSRRAGFEVAYARAILARPGPGLAAAAF